MKMSSLEWVRKCTYIYAHAHANIPTVVVWRLFEPDRHARGLCAAFRQRVFARSVRLTRVCCARARTFATSAACVAIAACAPHSRFWGGGGERDAANAPPWCRTAHVRYRITLFVHFLYVCVCKFKYSSSGSERWRVDARCGKNASFAYVAVTKTYQY